MIAPPTNSASANCQPISTQQHDPELDHEVRRGEHEDHRADEVGAALEERLRHRRRRVRARRRRRRRRRVARPISRGPRRPSRRSISARETNACTAPERAKPRMSAQSVTQNMKKASRNEWAMSVRTCTALRAAEPSAAGDGSRTPRRSTPPRKSTSSSTSVSATRFSATAPSACPGVATASSSPYIDASRDAEPRRREDEDDGDDRAYRGRPAQIDDRHRFGMGTDRAQQQPQREAAEHPRAGVEDEQLADHPSTHVRQLLLVADAPQHPPGDRPEDARLDEDCEHPAEGDERPERRVHVVDEWEADDEHDHTCDRREAGLEQHRRGDEGCVGYARAPRRDDAGGGSPDRAGDVLREHREHLRS